MSVSCCRSAVACAATVYYFSEAELELDEDELDLADPQIDNDLETYQVANRLYLHIFSTPNFLHTETNNTSCLLCCRLKWALTLT